MQKFIQLSNIVLFCLFISLNGQTQNALSNDNGNDIVFYQTVYKGEIVSNLTGGLERRTVYLDNFDIVFDFDLEKLFGLENSLFHIYFLGNNGKMPNVYIGSLQAISNISTVPTWKLYELYFSGKWFEDRFSLILGTLDLNSEYDAINIASLFINPSHGIGPDHSQSGYNGPSIFPSTSLALSVGIKLGENISFHGGIFGAVPGDIHNPKSSNIHIALNKGVMLTGELKYETGNDENMNSDYSRFAFGAWLYSNRYQDITMQNNPAAEFEKGNFGIYSYYERILADNILAGKTDWGMFLRAGYASEKFNAINYYIGLGSVLYNLFDESDALGIALGYAHINPRLSALGNDTFEMITEFTYSLNIFEWLSFQPDFQYVINPGAEKSIPNSSVFGTRVIMRF